MFNWAIVTGYAYSRPFKRNKQAVIELSKEIPRARRLRPADGKSLSEEDALVAASNPYLRAVILGALETGMRRDELLSLQSNQIQWKPKPEIVPPAPKNEGTTSPPFPMSSRLVSVLDMRKLDPSGQEFPPGAFVFGDELGGRVSGFKRAWQR
jgi:integrase